MGRMINLTEGMRFGAGVDGITEETRGLPIEFDGISDSAGGQHVDASVKMIESQEELMESMNLSVSASVRYGLASGDAKFSMAQQHSINHYSLYLLLSADVRNPARHMVRPRLSGDALRIFRNDPEQFRQIYGDMFVDEIYSGGDFFGLFTFETFDERSRTDLKASLEVSVGTFLAGGKISASFETSIEHAKSKSSMQIRAIMAGGAGELNPTNLEELKELYRNFNARVMERPIDYKASLKDFRYLPLPEGPTWAEQALRRDVIEQTGRRVIDGIRLRGDVDFILRYPDQFENVDEATLREMRDRYSRINAQLPKLAARARDCAQKIESCSLEGLESIETNLPKRRQNTGDPLQLKWEDILAHDSRAAGYLPAAGLASPITQYDRGPRGGRYKLFYSGGTPIGGIFWHPDLGASVVYGGIMQEYLRRGHCEGPLGYPKGDEAAITGEGADGLDRISYFENGYLWWDAQTQKVSDHFPFLANLRVRMPTGINATRLINR
jgi:hypothetical protein